MRNSINQDKITILYTPVNRKFNR